MSGDDSISALNTREKLIKIGIRLFSKFGYEGTSLRMIEKESQVNISSISFYFGNKSNFYKEVLEYAADDAIPLYFKSFYDEFINEKEKGSIEKNKALDLIEQLLSIQLYISINLPIPEYIALLYWEQIQPPENCRPITEKVKVIVEDSLAYLLTQYEPSLDYRKAAVLSRFINGGIVTFSEHPAFEDSIKNRIDQDPSDEFVKSTLKKYIVDSIKNLLNFIVK